MESCSFHQTSVSRDELLLWRELLDRHCEESHRISWASWVSRSWTLFQFRILEIFVRPSEAFRFLQTSSTIETTLQNQGVLNYSTQLNMRIRDSIVRKWKEHRISKLWTEMKRKLTEERAGQETCQNEECIELDEALTFMTGLAMDTPHSPEVQSFDPRFLFNPHGEGCSKNFEKRHSDTTVESEASPSSPISTDPTTPGFENADSNASPSSKIREPIFDPSTWHGPKALHIDWAEGKRKGKAMEEQSDTASMVTDWLTCMNLGDTLPLMEPDEESLQVTMAPMRRRACTC